MITSARAATDKRDLYFGGLGSDPPSALAAVVDPFVDASQNWVEKARELVDTADEYVRDNPWQAIGAMALIGVTVGFLLARRS